MTKWGFDIIVEAVRAFEEKLHAQPAPRQHDAPTLPDSAVSEPPPDNAPAYRRGIKGIVQVEVDRIEPIALSVARAIMRKQARLYLGVPYDECAEIAIAADQGAAGSWEDHDGS